MLLMSGWVEGVIADFVALAETAVRPGFFCACNPMTKNVAFTPSAFSTSRIFGVHWDRGRRRR